jgi:Amt family ammonium transporter
MFSRFLFRRNQMAFVSPLHKLSKAEKWRMAGAMFAGKIGGLLLLLGAIHYLPSLLGTAAHAQSTDSIMKSLAETKKQLADTTTSLQSTANTIWTLVAAFLVFGMQPGFVLLEAGFARARETNNILMECIFDTCLCGILFWAFGYGFMFAHGNGFIGTHWFFLSGTDSDGGLATGTYLTTGVPVIAHWIFQFAFADTCSTVTSGAMIGRTGFRGDILYSIGVTGFIYPIIGHWAWGPDGFLAVMGAKGAFLPTLGQPFRDFAGSTVVHSIGGMVSLAGAIVLGPRLGRVFRRDGGTPMPPHNITIAAVGGFILWFGWYGFNPGSTLSAVDFQGIGRVSTNTTLAACAGGMSAMLMALWTGPTKGKFDTGLTTNGFLAGLVAITCPCYWVDPAGAIGLGFIAGIIVVLGVYLLEYLRIDDPIGAVPVHGFCGMWGTWSLGLFASGKYGATGATGPDNSAPVTGWFYGGGPTVFEAQLIGSLTICAATLGVSLIMMWVIKQLPHPWNLRVEPEGEKIGLDIWEHGTEAYPAQ